MAINILTRTESDGQKHSFYLQTEVESCGPAALLMVEAIVSGQPAGGTSAKAKIMAIGARYLGS